MNIPKVRLPKSEKELKKRLFLPRKYFVETAKQRFNMLDYEYIKRKSTEEVFPIVGNAQIFLETARFIVARRNKLEQQKKIKIVDIGAAGGAITSLFTLKAFYDYGLLGKVELHLVDVAEDALKATKEGNFLIPAREFASYGFTAYPNLAFLKQTLSEAVIHVAEATSLPPGLGNADVVVSGFTHHHMNLADKKNACLEIVRITKKGGFIGITDESLGYKDYARWFLNHEHETNGNGETVPIAYESFLEMKEHIKLFRGMIRVVGEYPKSRNQREHYTFCGVKR